MPCYVTFASYKFAIKCDYVLRTDLVRVVRVHCLQVRHLQFPFYLHRLDVFSTILSEQLPIGWQIVTNCFLQVGFPM